MSAPRFFPRLIIFDLDGTLVDSLPDLHGAVNATLADFGLEPVTLAQVRAWVGNGAPKLLERAMRSRDVTPEQLPAYYARYALHYAAGLDRLTRPYPQVVETLGALRARGYRLAVCSNKAGRFVQPLLRAVGLGSFFESAIGGDEVSECKPSPRPLLHLAQLLGVRPSDTLMVGDSINDVAAARAAGMPVIALSYGYNHGGRIEDTAPDALLHSFAELPALLGRAEAT